MANAALAFIARILSGTFFCITLVTGVHAAIPDAVVIIYAKFPGYAAYELGTGTFIGHDGLILTADHVVHHLTVSPPSSYTLGSVPTPVTPISISVYSAFLNTKFDVDLNQSGNIVGGQLNSSQWIDVAFIRVSLNDTQRLLLQPLDLSSAPSSQGETLNAYGPLCTNVLDLRCFQPGVTGTVLNSSPALSRDYQVRDNIIPGYSGGPLVNASASIVAIASWGDVILANQVVVRASYIPAPYIVRYFLNKVQPSALLSGPNACTLVHSLSYLTMFDWQELSARWISQAALLQGSDQCACCCESLDKTRSAVGAPSENTCVPPFCAERRFYALTTSVTVALETKTIDDDTVAAYKGLKVAFLQIDLSNATNDKKAKLFQDLGTVLSHIATDDEAAGRSDFAKAGDEAILALNDSQQFRETPENYFAMADLFRKDGDVTHATAATVLGNVIGLPSSVVHSKLKIDPDVLRKDVQAAVKTQSQL